MLRILAALFAACCVLVGVSVPRGAAAQTWNDPATRALVERATERRARQLADTALVDYTAKAHGYLTFLAQLGEGLREPPKVVKTDELALEVYWKAPNLSKQRIVGRRDTLLLPTDIAYHRDHLGIVQNNFPDFIRLGDGDEVRDVPHPLSPGGLAAYDFNIADSLSIRLPDDTLNVFEVRVRPRDDRQPRVIGAVYIDRETAQVVRMAFNFTRAAFVDDQLEDLAIVLENALIDGRFWLPLRQEVEIRRAGTWLEYPARGIIRGRWEVCCYEVNRGWPPGLFAGPEIVIAPPGVLARHPWTGTVLDSLPADVRAVTDADVRRVQEDARALVRAEALARTRGVSLAVPRISEFARVNRVEGLALGAGTILRPGGGVSLTISGRWGVEDDEAKGRVVLALGRPTGLLAELFAERSYREAGDVAETSPLRNSFAAQEFGSDYTDPFDVRGTGAAIASPGPFAARWRIQAAYETHAPLSVNARPTFGRYERTLPALRLRGVRAEISADRPTARSWLGTDVQWSGAARVMRFSPRDQTLDQRESTVVRAFLSARIERAFGAGRLVLQSALGAVGGASGLPSQEYILLGGPTSGPGYGFHEFVARAGLSQRVEWRTPVSFPAIPLGRFGRAPATATLAPFVQAVYAHDAAPFAPRPNGVYPTVGAGALFLFDLLRVDVARGLRDGRWTFSLDIARDFWSVL